MATVKNDFLKMGYQQLEGVHDDIETFYKRFDNGNVRIVQFIEDVQKEPTGMVYLSKKQFDELIGKKHDGVQKYYALYDLQIDGFKAGYTGESYEEVLKSGVDRIHTLSESDEEPAPTDVSDEELMEMYGYEVREVTEKEYDIITNSDDHGLTTAVKL